MSNKLPANLPENWTQGDIIAPNGSDIGRPENYGYNYLNKQVNDAQTEINAINDILGEVAQQDDLIAVKNAIGTPASTSESTVFGKLNKLKTDLAAVNETITSSLKRNTTAAYEYVVHKNESGLRGANQIDVSVNMKGVVKQIIFGFDTEQVPTITRFTMTVDGETIYDNISVGNGQSAAPYPLTENSEGRVIRYGANRTLYIGESLVSAYAESNISISFRLYRSSGDYGYTLAFLQERQ